MTTWGSYEAVLFWVAFFLVVWAAVGLLSLVLRGIGRIARRR